MVETNATPVGNIHRKKKQVVQTIQYKIFANNNKVVE